MSAGPPFSFSEQERAILDLLAQGLDNAQIGAQLGLAPRTVGNILSRLYQQLGDSIDHTNQSSVLRLRLALWWMQYRTILALLPHIEDSLEADDM